MSAEEMEALRKTLGFTQAEMAKALGIGLTTYSEMIRRGEIEERYRLAAERVALSIAVQRGNPMLAPPSIRKEALALANLITEG
jgi:DNA-binding XRE family transcriptional regulator